MQNFMKLVRPLCGWLTLLQLEETRIGNVEPKPPLWRLPAPWKGTPDVFSTHYCEGLAIRTISRRSRAAGGQDFLTVTLS